MPEVTCAKIYSRGTLRFRFTALRSPSYNKGYTVQPSARASPQIFLSLRYRKTSYIPNVIRHCPHPPRYFYINIFNYTMKILIFTEGTIIMHKNAVCHTRDEIVQQVENEEKSVPDYKSYVPVGNAVKKLQNWKNDGAEILYLTSRKKSEEIQQIQNVLKKFKFPDGQLLFRQKDEEYKDVAERIVPDALVEDDCESIGGIDEMTITHVKPEIKKKIKSIPIKEFGGIDHLPDKISAL